MLVFFSQLLSIQLGIKFLDSSRRPLSLLLQNKTTNISKNINKNIIKKSDIKKETESHYRVILGIRNKTTECMNHRNKEKRRRV